MVKNEEANPLMGNKSDGRHDDGMSMTHSIGVVTQLERWNDKFGRKYLRKDILIDDHGNIQDVQEPAAAKQK